MRSRRGREDGVGVVGTFFGALAFLAFVALATHTLLGLYATSVLTAVTADEAHELADTPNDPARMRTVENDARRRLHGFKNVDISMRHDDDGAIGVHVEAHRPQFLPLTMMKNDSVTRIERTAWARNEELR